MAVHPSEISIIIPLAPNDNADALLAQLEGCGADIIVSSEGNRAKSLNMGAAKSSKKFLWSLHADSMLPINALEKLCEALQDNEKALHYFTLTFAEDGPALMHLNAAGANFRSRAFGVPFGDQGLCLRKDLFFSIGGYPEDVSYGEDHLFVWHARRHGIMVEEVQTSLITSARRYRDHGWLKTTLLYQFLWIKQAVPQLLLLLAGK